VALHRRTGLGPWTVPLGQDVGFASVTDHRLRARNKLGGIRPARRALSGIEPSLGKDNAMTNGMRKIALVAAAVGASLMLAAPAQAGRSTGTWKYSPQEIWAYQRAQRHAAWEQRHRWGPPMGYYRGYGAPRYGYRPYPRWDNDY
jgi:hypothetical protein